MVEAPGHPVQKRDQVGHLLEADGLFEPLGHEGLAGGAELFDLGAEEGFLDALGAAELTVVAVSSARSPEKTWPRRVASGETT